MSSRAVAAGRLTSLCLSIRITPIRVRGGVYNPFRDRPWSFLFIYPPTYAWLAGMSQMFMAKTNFQSRIICMRNVTNIFLNTKLFFLISPSPTGGVTRPVGGSGMAMGAPLGQTGSTRFLRRPRSCPMAEGRRRSHSRHGEPSSLPRAVRARSHACAPRPLERRKSASCGGRHLKPPSRVVVRKGDMKGTTEFSKKIKEDKTIGQNIDPKNGIPLSRIL